MDSAYAAYRRKFLEAGVDLYEVRANATAVDATTGEQPDSVTLHTKAVSIDERYTFVGSLNLDPCSIDINTEMGVLIDSATLSKPLPERFKQRLTELAYKLELDVLWGATIDGEEVESSEPLRRTDQRVVGGGVRSRPVAIEVWIPSCAKCWCGRLGRRRS